MEPVVCPPGDPCALTEGDLPVLYEQYEILAREMLRRAREGDPLVFYHYMIDLKHGPCIYKRISGCGSGTEYMAVTPWGELFPCHQFVGEEKYSLGNIWDGVLHPEVQEEFRSVQRLLARRVPRLLGPPLLLRRLRREQLPRHWQRKRRLRSTAASSSKSA